MEGFAVDAQKTVLHQGKSHMHFPPIPLICVQIWKQLLMICCTIRVDFAMLQQRLNQFFRRSLPVCSRSPQLRSIGAALASQLDLATSISSAVRIEAYSGTGCCVQRAEGRPR